MAAVKIQTVLADADAVGVRVVGVDRVGENEPGDVLGVYPAHLAASPTVRRSCGPPLTVTGSLKVNAMTMDSPAP